MPISDTIRSTDGTGGQGLFRFGDKEVELTRGDNVNLNAGLDKVQ
jgi:hypothetical protein